MGRDLEAMNKDQDQTLSRAQPLTFCVLVCSSAMLDWSMAELSLYSSKS